MQELAPIKVANLQFRSDSSDDTYKSWNSKSDCLIINPQDDDFVKIVRS